MAEGKERVGQGFWDLLVTTMVVEAGDAKVVRMTVTVVVVLECRVAPPVVLVMVAGLLSVLVFCLFARVGGERYGMRRGGENPVKFPTPMTSLAARVLEAGSMILRTYSLGL